MKQKIVRIVVWIVVIAGLLFTANTLVNNFDHFEFSENCMGASC
jgi:hypothetical protein